MDKVAGVVKKADHRIHERSIACLEVMDPG